MWTRFMDMHSGGGLKEAPFDKILIEAPADEAKVIFYNRFGHNPERVTCTCRGEDYSIGENESLEQLTAFDRGCRYAYFSSDGSEVPESEAWVSGRGLVNGCTGKYIEEPSQERFSFQKFLPLEAYLQLPTVLTIRADEITQSERHGVVPEQGCVWVG